MGNKSHAFSYYLGWILVGLVTGFVVLTMQGYIQLTVFGQHIGNNAKNGTQAMGFAHAVTQASSSVVSIQAARYVPSATPSASQLLLERFLGQNSPHAPKY